MKREQVQSVGQAIRNIRVARGMTLRDLGAAVGSSHAPLSQIETGARNPSLEMLEKIASALGTTPAAFWPGTTSAPLEPATAGVFVEVGANERLGWRTGDQLRFEYSDAPAEGDIILFKTSDRPGHTVGVVGTHPLNPEELWVFEVGGGQNARSLTDVNLIGIAVELRRSLRHE